jgi:hypothetical protein
MSKNAAIVFLVLVNAVLAWTIWSGLQLRHLARQEATDAHHSAVKEHALLVRQFDELAAKQKNLADQTSQLAEAPTTRTGPPQDERPEAIAARRDDVSVIVARENRLLFARLALTPPERSALIDLLSTRHLRRSGSDVTADDEDEADAQFRKEVSSVLPPEKAAIAIDMVLDHPEAWSEVATLDHALRYEGKMLTDAQQTAFAGMFIDAWRSAWRSIARFSIRPAASWTKRRSRDSRVSSRKARRLLRCSGTAGCCWSRSHIRWAAEASSETARLTFRALKWLVSTPRFSNVCPTR